MLKERKTKLAQDLLPAATGLIGVPGDFKAFAAAGKVPLQITAKTLAPIAKGVVEGVVRELVSEPKILKQIDLPKVFKQVEDLSRFLI